MPCITLIARYEMRVDAKTNVKHSEGQVEEKQNATEKCTALLENRTRRSVRHYSPAYRLLFSRARGCVSFEIIF